MACLARRTWLWLTVALSASKAKHITALRSRFHHFNTLFFDFHSSKQHYDILNRKSFFCL